MHTTMRGGWPTQASKLVTSAIPATISITAVEPNMILFNGIQLAAPAELLVVARQDVFLRRLIDFAIGAD